MLHFLGRAVAALRLPVAMGLERAYLNIKRPVIVVGYWTAYRGITLSSGILYFRGILVPLGLRGITTRRMRIRTRWFLRKGV
jgi:hypothetical protein